MKQITNVNLESDNAGGTVEVTYPMIRSKG